MTAAFHEQQYALQDSEVHGCTLMHCTITVPITVEALSVAQAAGGAAPWALYRWRMFALAKSCRRSLRGKKAQPAVIVATPATPAVDVFTTPATTPAAGYSPALDVAQAHVQMAQTEAVQVPVLSCFCCSLHHEPMVQ